MNPLLLRVFLITVVSLPVDFASSSKDNNNFISYIEIPEAEYSEGDSEQHIKNKTLVILVPYPTDDAERRYGYDKVKLLNNKDLSGDNLQTKNNTKEKRSNVGDQSQTTKRRRKIRTSPPKDRDESEKKKEHERKLNIIENHIKEHFMSSLYLYNETKRIMRTKVVMDELRVIAVLLEDPRKSEIRDYVMKCGHIPEHSTPKPIWRKPNNLVIDIIKDSLNYGVII